MEGTLELDGAQKQIVIVALAELALSRPGWDEVIGEIVDIYNERAAWMQLKLFNRDRVGAMAAELAAARTFEFTVRGMADHGLTVVEKTATEVTVRCACGLVLGPFASIAGIFPSWYLHVAGRTAISA
jgi:hypothetical protein